MLDVLGRHLDDRLTLKSSPNKVQQHALEKRNVGSAQTPSESVLDREANMPRQATPGDDTGEERDEESRYNDNHHGLADRQTLRQKSVGCLPCRDVERATSVMRLVLVHRFPLQGQIVEVVHLTARKLQRS